jgi:hypothetical protein
MELSGKTAEIINKHKAKADVIAAQVEGMPLAEGMEILGVVKRHLEEQAITASNKIREVPANPVVFTFAPVEPPAEPGPPA